MCPILLVSVFVSHFLFPHAVAQATAYPHLTHFVRLVRIAGIEPAIYAWEAHVLPLNYIRNLF